MVRQRRLNDGPVEKAVETVNNFLNTYGFLTLWKPIMVIHGQKDELKEIGQIPKVFSDV